MSTPGSEHVLTNPKWALATLASPYARELGFELRSADPEWCVLALPYQAKLIGNPATGVLHGGAITALIDSCYGLAVFARLNKLRGMATLDLRIDYLKPATPGRDVLGGAVCHKLTQELAFVRGCAYHDTPDDPIATSVSIFMFTGVPMVAPQPASQTP